MSVIKFTRQVAKYRRGMKDRIERRIQQLEEQREEIRVEAILQDHQIRGQIQALKDVLTAIENERPSEQAEQQEMAHVG